MAKINSTGDILSYISNLSELVKGKAFTLETPVKTGDTDANGGISSLSDVDGEIQTSYVTITNTTLYSSYYNNATNACTAYTTYADKLKNLINRTDTATVSFYKNSEEIHSLLIENDSPTITVNAVASSSSKVNLIGSAYVSYSSSTSDGLNHDILITPKENAIGSGIISVSVNGSETNKPKSVSLPFTVITGAVSPGLTPTEISVSGAVGETKIISASCMNGATIYFESSDDTYATVSSNGANSFDVTLKSTITNQLIGYICAGGSGFTTEKAPVYVTVYKKNNTPVINYINNDGLEVPELELWEHVGKQVTIIIDKVDTTAGNPSLTSENNDCINISSSYSQTTDTKWTYICTFTQVADITYSSYTTYLHLDMPSTETHNEYTYTLTATVNRITPIHTLSTVDKSTNGVIGEFKELTYTIGATDGNINWYPTAIGNGICAYVTQNSLNKTGVYCAYSGQQTISLFTDTTNKYDYADAYFIMTVGLNSVTIPDTLNISYSGSSSEISDIEVSTSAEFNINVESEQNLGITTDFDEDYLSLTDFRYNGSWCSYTFKALRPVSQTIVSFSSVNKTESDSTTIYTYIGDNKQKTVTINDVSNNKSYYEFSSANLTFTNNGTDIASTTYDFTSASAQVSSSSVTVAAPAIAFSYYAGDTNITVDRRYVPDYVIMSDPQISQSGDTGILEFSLTNYNSSSVNSQIYFTLSESEQSKETQLEFIFNNLPGYVSGGSSDTDKNYFTFSYGSTTGTGTYTNIINQASKSSSATILCSYTLQRTDSDDVALISCTPSENYNLSVTTNNNFSTGITTIVKNGRLIYVPIRDVTELSSSVSETEKTILNDYGTRCSSWECTLTDNSNNYLDTAVNIIALRKGRLICSVYCDATLLFIPLASASGYDTATSETITTQLSVTTGAIQYVAQTTANIVLKLFGGLHYLTDDVIKSFISVPTCTSYDVNIESDKSKWDVTRDSRGLKYEPTVEVTIPIKMTSWNTYISEEHVIRIVTNTDTENVSSPSQHATCVYVIPLESHTSL